MAFVCACYFMNYLDRQAFANAYVAGLKESLNLKGNEYSILLSIYTAGMVVAQIPHALILQKVRPSIWLPLTLVVWSGLTMCSAACKNYAQLAAVRFLQGMAEASLYGGTIYVMGSWYKPSEIAKRTAIFTAIGQVGSMSAGLMMTAMHKTMEGRAGLAGWQWVFIIDGVIGLPIGIWGFLAFPDLPETTKVKYLSEAEKKLSLSRLPPKKKDGHNIAWRSLLKARLHEADHLRPRKASLWCPPCSKPLPIQGMLLLWAQVQQALASRRLPSIHTRLGIQAVAIVSQIVAGAYIDHTNHRLPAVLFAAAMQVITASLLLVRDMSDAGIFVAHYLSGTSFIVNPVMYGWASNICQKTGDDAVRAVVLYAMAMGGLLLYTFWGIVMYPATDVPYWRKGSITMLVVCFVFVGYAFVVRWLDRQTDMIESEETGSEGGEVEENVVKVAHKQG
ncbi:hypothetical protein SNOG_09999 [Parastagonospora nodorum SN15]|uniref:Major facilitator superfamily (MFS) profile domain-containing protein n=1 Tax=Phaeosphaeria nodorum (strain SN15 / ATCC MYA-4574 / FGSC 10173) TaxID=321614 RepID=Q0UE15_PHANO|nr:hypothetical protein SNOG_09999 [Parastagonospora nodorum SN15]EAT82334.1 hypothetical protein SNOG_09999 [Parastagonospora nodorum SN15]